jgi:hypothetical protein
MRHNYIDLTKAIQYGAITHKLHEIFFVGDKKFYARIVGDAFKKQNEKILENLIPKFSFYTMLLQLPICKKENG